MNFTINIYKPLLTLFLLAHFSCSYLPETNTDHPNLIVEENADYILLTTVNTNNDKAGIMFYPGGLVDPHAYITALQDLVLEDNRTVVILKVASNLAILNSKKATDYADKIDAANRWVLGGHSLGGSTACIDVFNHPNTFDGLFMLAAYSINDLSNINIPVLSITASNDQVLDLEKLNENKVNLPAGIAIDGPLMLSESTIGNTIYYNIEGGNHAQFGNYGDQKGDGEATINSEMQHKLVVEMLKIFLDVNEL